MKATVKFIGGPECGPAHEDVWFDNLVTKSRIVFPLNKAVEIDTESPGGNNSAWLEHVIAGVKNSPFHEVAGGEDAKELRVREHGGEIKAAQAAKSLPPRSSHR